MLNKKLCPVCRKYSYSAITRGQWICPTCGADISRFEGKPLDQNDIKVGLDKEEEPPLYSE